MFYVLHVAPEFISAAILMSLNARRVFGTGPWGDRLGKDPTPKKEGEESGAAKKTKARTGGRRWGRRRGNS